MGGSMLNFKDYPLKDRCAWWCDMNAKTVPKNFPFKYPDDEFSINELFDRLSKATPVMDRLILWNERHTGTNRHNK